MEEDEGNLYTNCPARAARKALLSMFTAWGAVSLAVTAAAWSPSKQILGRGDLTLATPSGELHIVMIPGIE